MTRTNRLRFVIRWEGEVELTRLQQWWSSSDGGGEWWDVPTEAE